jgi:hypothetical protein
MPEMAILPMGKSSRKHPGAKPNLEDHGVNDCPTATQDRTDRPVIRTHLADLLQSAHPLPSSTGINHRQPPQWEGHARERAEDLCCT